MYIYIDVFFAFFPSMRIGSLFAFHLRKISNKYECCCYFNTNTVYSIDFFFNLQCMSLDNVSGKHRNDYAKKKQQQHIVQFTIHKQMAKLLIEYLENQELLLNFEKDTCI